MVEEAGFHMATCEWESRTWKLESDVRHARTRAKKAQKEGEMETRLQRDHAHRRCFLTPTPSVSLQQVHTPSATN